MSRNSVRVELICGYRGIPPARWSAGGRSPKRERRSRFEKFIQRGLPRCPKQPKTSPCSRTIGTRPITLRNGSRGTRLGTPSGVLSCGECCRLRRFRAMPSWTCWTSVRVMARSAKRYCRPSRRLASRCRIILSRCSTAPASVSPSGPISSATSSATSSIRHGQSGSAAPSTSPSPPSPSTTFATPKRSLRVTGRSTICSNPAALS